MNRSEAIAVIEAQLPALDDAHVLAVAEMVRALSSTTQVPRRLSPREQALLNQSRQDFEAGRTLTFEELVTNLNTRLASQGVPPYKP